MKFLPILIDSFLSCLLDTLFFYSGHDYDKKTAC